MAIIPDEDIALSQTSDLLGTKVYSDTLLNLIDKKANNKPLTIGLFGRWGTGKSSVIKTLTNELDNRKDIKHHTYDAWKYSEDAFRRSFLLSLKEGFGLSPEKELELFYRDKNEEIDHKIGIDKNSWIHLIVLTPLLFLFVWLTPLDQDVKLVTTLFSPFLAIISYFVKESFIKYKISISRPKFFSPEQFEEAFKEIIDELTSPTRFSLKWVKQKLKLEEKVKKIVIVIDNIDRCERDLAKELILTVKNFLGIKNCIFIIPIDDSAIKKHLGFEANEGEEFLRKFFNTTIRIKDFANQDLYDYTYALIEKYDLNFSNNVCTLIAQEFAKNPRRIIQFLNNLYSEKIVAEFQENNGLIEKGLITGNLDFLAKMLIIKEEFPRVYEKINFDIQYLNRIDNGVINNNYKIENGFDLTENEIRFFKRSTPITAKKIEPFIRIKDGNKGISNDVYSYIMSQDWEKLKTVISEDLTFEKLKSVIHKELDLAVTHRASIEVDAYNLISLIFKISQDSFYQNEFDNFYKYYEPFIINVHVKSILLKFDPELLMNYCKKLNSKGEDYLKKNIIDQINAQKPDYSKEHIKTFALMFSDDTISLRKIKTTFSELLSMDFANYREYEDLLNKEGILKTLADEKLILYAVTNSTSEKIAFIKKLNKEGLINDDNNTIYLSKVSTLVNTSSWEDLFFWLNSMEGFILKSKKQDLHEAIYRIFNNIYGFIKENYDKGLNSEIHINTYNSYVQLLFELFTVSPGHRNQTAKWLKAIFSQPIEPGVYMTINKFYRSFIKDGISLPIADILFTKLQSTTWENQIEIAQTINEILVHKHTEFGMTPDKIQSISDYYISLLLNDETKFEKILEWVSFIKTNDTVLESISKSIDKLKHEDRIKYVKHIDKISDDRFVRNIPEIILTSSKSYNEFILNMKIVSESLQNASEYLKNILWKIYTEHDKSNSEFTYTITVICIENKTIIGANNLTIIIDKLLELLSDEFNINGQTFALEMLNKIERKDLSEDRIILLNTCLNEISHTDITDTSLHKEVKDKYKYSVPRKDSFEITFRKQEKDDHHFNKLLNLDKYKYEILIHPSSTTDYWRCGVKLSKDVNLTSERLQKSIPLFHLTKEKDSEILYVNFYKEDHTHFYADKKHQVHTNYKTEPIIFELASDDNGITVTIKDSNNKPLLVERILDSTYKYGRLLAWGDNNDFTLESKVKRNRISEN